MWLCYILKQYLNCYNAEWCNILIVTGSEGWAGPSRLVVVTVTVIFVMGLQSDVDSTWNRCLHSPFGQAETGIVAGWLQILGLLKSE